MAQKGTKRNGTKDFSKRGRKTIIKGMAAKKKKPEAPKRAKAGGKTDDDPLSYARIPVNMRKTDYDDLVEFERENGIFNHASVVRQFVLEKLKAWKESKAKKDSGIT